MLGSDRLADVTAGDATQRTKFFCLQVSGWPIVSRDRAKVIALTEKQGAESGFAELCRIRQHGLKDRPQLAGGRADNAQHIRSRRLLLQRLPKFVKQPRVLNGDDCLSGEILYKRNLLVGEGPDLLAIDGDSADQHIVFEHRNGDQRSCAAERGRWAGFGNDIGTVTYLLCPQSALKD